MTLREEIKATILAVDEGYPSRAYIHATAAAHLARKTLLCPSCQTPIPDALVRSCAASLAVHARKHHGGPQRVLRPCALCGEQFGAREMRKHVPACRIAKEDRFESYAEIDPRCTCDQPQLECPLHPE